MQRAIKESLRILDLLKNASNEEIAKMIPIIPCKKCILHDKCKATIGGRCNEIIIEYLEGREW